MSSDPVQEQPAIAAATGFKQRLTMFLDAGNLERLRPQLGY